MIFLSMIITLSYNLRACGGYFSATWFYNVELLRRGFSDIDISKRPVCFDRAISTQQVFLVEIGRMAMAPPFHILGVPSSALEDQVRSFSLSKHGNLLGRLCECRKHV